MKQDMTLKTFVRGIAAAAVALLAAAACDKPFEMDLPLAVNQHTISLKKEAGSTHILIWSDGSWTARFDHPVDWGSLNKASGMGNSDIVFSYAANYGISRSVGLVLEKGELRDTITINQDGPYTINGEGGHTDFGVQFNSLSTTLIRSAATVRTPYSATVPYSRENMRIVTEFLAEDGSSLGAVTFGEEVPDTMWVTPWLTVGKLENNAVEYTVTENNSGALRTAAINLEVVDAQGHVIKTTQTVLQGMDEAAFALEKANVEVLGGAGVYTVPCSANNIYAYRNNLTYEFSADWIKAASLNDDGLAYLLEANETGSPRSGKITVTYKDDAGNTITQTLDLTQLPFFSFADARNLPEGEITSDQVIDGYLVTDPDGENNCQNSQIAQFSFDITESHRTAVYQSTDGKLGFMLKFTSEGEYTFPRYTRLRLRLKGLTLVKTTDPVTYTLTGVSEKNIYEVLDPDPKLPVKSRSIDDLTDDDINTLVDLQDVEILCKDGCYTNCTDGYSIKAGPNPISGTGSAPRWDVAPLLMSDRNGNVIYMLTNSMAPWRRTGTKYGNGTDVVAQGSGTFRGVITSEELVRYGNVGRYQIRAIEKSDIILSGKAFSTTLVEWNWNDKKADVIPEIGEGELNFYGGAVTAASDYNSMMPHEENLTKGNAGLVPSASIYVDRNWWNWAEDTGNYFDVSFSTEGIRGTNLVFGFTWNHGKMGNTTLDSPTHWKLLYSTDGTSFKQVPDTGIIENRSIVWWTTTSQDSCPGYKDFLFKLPNECFNCEKVVLRMQVADKVTDIVAPTSASTYLTNLGIGLGTLTNKSTQIRFGTITVRYN